MQKFSLRGEETRLFDDNLNPNTDCNIGIESFYRQYGKVESAKKENVISTEESFIISHLNSSIQSKAMNYAINGMPFFIFDGNIVLEREEAAILSNKLLYTHLRYLKDANNIFYSVQNIGAIRLLNRLNAEESQVLVEQLNLIVSNRNNNRLLVIDHNEKTTSADVPTIFNSNAA